ncbi:mechanosensitive ion channel family protein [Alcanivorax sp. S6407]|uniref:mechanosensitive ion channel family protein n=1 Tax=Alcanivorax sp. S6407 TaxID=2926424 RepID=UPI001FF35981|nr:mechanosensitive ion channel family protein [Alcanivorax sp. S6407]MCK0155513.1 mechanosensitive ion channel family protein [Alcanivorax sp. S6407]
MLRNPLLLCLFFFLSALTHAREATPTFKDVLDSGEKAEAVIAEAQEDDSLQPGDTPLSTMLAIIDATERRDWAAAGEYLDMRYLPADMADADPAVLIEQLSIVWGQQRILDLTRLSNEPEGHNDDGLPSYRDKVGTLVLPEETLPLYLQRIPENGRRVWKVSNSTVREIPRLWDTFGYNPAITQLADYLPDFTLLHMQNWQVAGLLLIVIGAWIIAALSRRLLLALLERSDRYRDTLHRFFSVPLRWFLFFKLLQTGVAELGLSIKARVYLNESALGYLATVFLALGIIELLTALFLSNATNQKYWSGIIRPLRTILKMIAIVVIFLLWLSDSGYDITTVLTGLGIGSIAIALAAQKTLENVIGAFTLYIAKPIQPGDFCKVGTTAGVIEEIGLRSTRIRRMDRSVVYVPNSVLSSASIENISESDFRRYQRDLHIRLGATPDQLRNLLADLRRLIYSHPRLTEKAARVRFVEILRDSYRLQVNCYVDSSDWNQFLAVSEDLNLRILSILEQHGMQLAVPVQQWVRGDSRAAEQATALPAETLQAFPDYDGEEKEEMKGSLDYPEKGRTEE